MKLSKTKISSFCGDVLPIELISENDITKADIEWYVKGDAVTVRAFSKDEPYSYKNQALITFIKPGKATVCAKISNEVYVCEIDVREAKKADPNKKMNYYIGDFHDHTSNDHKYDSFALKETDFPIDYITQVRDEGLLDFGVISDHGDVTNDKDFFRGFTDTEKAGPMELVIFPGCESEVTVIEEDRYGLTHKNSGEIVTVNANNYAAAKTWEEFYENFKESPFAVMVLAHPQVVGWDKNGIWNFSLHKNNAPYFKEVLRGVEMGDGSVRGSNAINEYYYSVALDNGFKVSPTCSSDSHGPKWGYHRFPGKTIIMAPEKSKEMFLDALWNRRFYACESGNIKLYYTVNGKGAAQTLDITDKYSFHVKCDYFNEDLSTVPVKCQVISDFGKTVKTIENVDFSNFEFDIESSDASYFYLRLVDSEGRKTWSAPVWTSREPKGTTPPQLKPINKKGFTVTDVLTDKNADILINDDPENIWTSDFTTAEVVIDMKDQKEFCGIGHYPARILIKPLMAAGIPITEKINELVSEYEISVSNDNTNYTTVANGIFRIFGAEEIVTFKKQNARYVKFKALKTAGLASERKQNANAKVSIGELTVYSE